MKKQTIGHQRLAKLATFLYSVPRKHFDIRRWATDGFNASAPACGTTACAVGWSAELFKDDGFYLARPNAFRTTMVPHYHGVTNWEAVTALFGISRRNAVSLFSYFHKPDIGPRQVAKNIKHFLKTNEAIKA